MLKGLRFRKGLRLFPGARVNLSKSGASLSLGKKGLTWNIGRKGTRTTVGLPGSGLSYSSHENYSDLVKDPGFLSPRRVFFWVVIVLVIIALVKNH